MEEATPNSATAPMRLALKAVALIEHALDTRLIESQAVS